MKRIEFKKTMIGKRYGRLVVKKFLYKKSCHLHFLCKCDCGNTTIAHRGNLKRGSSKSCGCLAKEILIKRSEKHGLYKNGKPHRIANIYNGMKARCYKPQHIFYHLYGGRGITICEEWLKNIKAFMKWALINGYNSKLTIDRKDNDKGYSPDNCRFVTQKEQMNNRACSKKYLYKNVLYTTKEISVQFNINEGTIKSRLRRGWNINKVIERTIEHKYRKRY